MAVAGVGWGLRGGGGSSGVWGDGSSGVWGCGTENLQGTCLI